MSSYSPQISGLGSSDNNPNPTRKNHWFFKLCPHIIILGLLLGLVIEGKLLNILLIVIMIIFGSRVHKDELIVKDNTVIMLTAFAFLETYTIINYILIIKKVGLYTLFPWFY